MPKAGERKLILRPDKKHRRTMLWHQCLKCGKCRWIRVDNITKSNFTGLCEKCRKTSKGRRLQTKTQGRIKQGRGYVLIRVYSDDFFFSMADCSGYVLEHRLVVAKALGRNLHRWEIVHHKKGFAKDDNKYPETLQLVTDDRHKQITILEVRINYLERLLRGVGVKFNG